MLKLFFLSLLIIRFVTHRSEIRALLNVKYPRRHQKDMQFISTLWVCRHIIALSSHHLTLPFSIEPLTSVIGGPDIFVNFGSTINLTCIVKNSPESPFAMFWTHNNIVSWLMLSNQSQIIPNAVICVCSLGAHQTF